MGVIKSNLPIDSQPWGRDIEDRLTSAESSITASNIDNLARDAQLQSAIDSISATVAQGNTAIQSQHKVYTWDLAGAMWAKPPVLTFTKPSWANAASVETTVKIVAASTYNSGVSYPITGFAGIFIDGDQATIEQSEWTVVGPDIILYKQVNPNTKSISAVATSTNTSVVITSNIYDVTTKLVNKNTLSVWAAMQSSSNLTNEIPPENYADWTAEQKARWNVGITVNSQLEIEILSTVTWLAQ